MKKLVAVLATVAGLMPGFALAYGECPHDRARSAQISCADGHAWDAKSARCVPVNS